MPSTAHKKAAPAWTATNSMRQTAPPKPTMKRKMAAKEPKFYAVRFGRVPGVYETYAECNENISGFKGAKHKSFPTRAQAQDFVNGKDTSKPQKFYAMARSRKVGIYTDWELAKLTIDGWKKPIYQGFDNLAAAEKFMRDHGEKPIRIKTSADMQKEGGEEGEEDVEVEQDEDEDDEDDEDDGEDEDEDDDEDELTLPPAKKLKGGVLGIWTDGACTSNGKKGAVAGYGVWFGEGDPRNATGAVTGEQTNQRGELTAIQRALEVAPDSQAVKITTDSEYSINCVTKWAQGWVKKGWLTSTGTPVKNRDLIEEIVRLIAVRTAKGVATDFDWVKGHGNDPGNIAADALARRGARMPRS